jgi:DNA replication protein DnaC
VRDRHNVFITGPTGIGKTWLGCALGHKACREGLTALYLRLPRLWKTADDAGQDRLADSR